MMHATAGMNSNSPVTPAEIPPEVGAERRESDRDRDEARDWTEELPGAVARSG
jgi:hypothetical protein